MITSYGYGLLGELLGEKKTDKASNVPMNKVFGIPVEKKKRQTKKKTPKN